MSDASPATRFDGANAADPNRVVVDGEDVPLALCHGERADAWVVRLAPGARDEVRLAARAHHLRRWLVPRTSYPTGRAGYLRWRRDQKERHAQEVTVILQEAGYPDPFVVRVAELVVRHGLGRDPETQLVEDAACLVFAETQLAELAARLDADKLHAVLAKTRAKMSPAAAGLLDGLLPTLPG